MNNVWSSIAVQAPRARRQAGPLLELFNGYARCHSGKASSHARLQKRVEQTARIWQYPQHATVRRRAFSASTILSARKLQRPPPPPPVPGVPPKSKPAEASKLEPAQTVASHTEGVSLQDQSEPISWRDYDPEGGMPLPGGELSQPEINRIFGNEDIDAENGNYILNVMHRRRQSGALVDSGIDFPRRSGVSREQALQALQYVRSLDTSFDEQAAGQQWAEEETLRLQEELQNRAVEVGIYKRDKDVEYYEGEEADQGTPEGRERSGESVLRTHREEREAAWEVEQAEKAAKQEREQAATLRSTRGPLELSGGVQPAVAMTTTGSGGITIGSGPRSAWLAPIERKPWVKYYEEQANLIKDNILPKMSNAKRLTPSLLVVLLTLAGSYYLSENYTPPPTSARMWPDTKPAVATLTAITALLGVAFIANRFPPLWKAFNKYFTIVPAVPTAASMIGSMFRHTTFYHIAVNTLFLWSFGLTLHEDVGRGTFLAIFFSAGAVGGYVSLTHMVLRKLWVGYAYGVSAAALGVFGAACTLRPNGTLQIGSVELPFAAWILVVLFAGVDVIAAARGMRTGIDHFGHIGGLATGLTAGLLLRRQGQSQKKEGLMQYETAAVTKASEEGGVSPVG
ncbi:hypothetical protein LTR56_019768 [Elasticomyces elasticus]|nr:hypothetical protein LTR56_019768 [Elasticomyces elasticus]KAK3642564.1 hypothetical protein LTR22_016002 [Elasticomyces elasticus]KAK4911300.1 hypothetical protein LTR49_020120 [Elasticomyces elasticus]KAK5745034.1 hypothetical protein LTS12_023270 [Elasticomyces elasticus]